MKKLFMAVVVLVCILGAGPLVSGYKAEQSLDQWVDYLNSVGGYEASWDYYNKDWLTTDAVLLIRLKQPLDLPLGEGVAQNWVLPLHIQMNHGPILVKDNFRQGWFSGKVFLSDEHEGWIKEHIQVNGEGPFYTSNIYMDLGASIHVSDHSLPFTLTDDGDTLTVQGYVGSGKMTLDQEISYSGLIPSITLSGESGSLTIDDVDMSVTSNLAKKYGKYIAPGKAHFGVKSVRADLGPDLTFSLLNVVLDSEVVFNEGQKDANMTFRVGVNEYTSPKESFSDARFALTFERLSLSFFDKYMDMVQEFGSFGAEDATLMAMQMSQLAASDLIPFGPKVSVSELHIKSKDGQLDFSGDIEIAAGAASKMANPMSMITDLTVNASAELDKALAHKLTVKSTLQDINNQLLQSGEIMTEEEKIAMAEQQATMQLSMLLIQGVLVDKDPKYTSHFQFVNGAAQLNGQNIPLPF